MRQHAATKTDNANPARMLVPAMPGTLAFWITFNFSTRTTVNLATQIALISAGGALGALGRTGLGAWMTSRFDASHWGTLAANLIGCLIMGAAKAAVTHMDWGSAQARAFLFSGLLGAFTTFSTFEADTVALWHNGQRILAISYCVSSVLFGLLAFGLGWWLTTKMIPVAGAPS